jgi:hypothetical protein
MTIRDRWFSEAVQPAPTGSSQRHQVLRSTDEPKTSSYLRLKLSYDGPVLTSSTIL